MSSKAVSDVATAGLMHRTQILALIGLMLLIQGQDLEALPPEGAPGWDDSNYSTAFDPGNRRSRNPVYSTAPVRSSVGVRRDAIDEPLPEDSGAGSGGFHLTIPVVRLPGRGLDLALDLYYNSRLWHKNPRRPFVDQGRMVFDVDGGWPAAGWSLGFGKMIWSVDWGMLIDADGTRHSFKMIERDYTPDGFRRWYGATTDGSLIDYEFRIYGNGWLSRAWARYPDGRFVEYGAQWDNVFFPTRITDANGNYIIITYRNNQGPHLETITDTLARTIRFHYDTNNRLTAVTVTGPGLNASTRPLIRLHYRSQRLQYAFAPGVEPIDVNPLNGTITINPIIWTTLIDAISYPATGTGYWFGDSYSSYGMLAKVSERRGMSLAAASVNDQGTVTPGTMTRERVYNYPLGPDPSLTDAPTYTTVTETWAAMDTSEAVTTYGVQQNATPRRLEVTYPDGTRRVQLSYNTPGQLTDGLVDQVETYDASNKLLQRTKFTWAQRTEGGVCEPPCVTRVEATDELNQTTKTEYSYGPN